MMAKQPIYISQVTLPFSFSQEAQEAEEEMSLSDEETNQRNQAGEDDKDDVSRTNTNVSEHSWVKIYIYTPLI